MFQGSGFRVQGSGFRVQDLRAGVYSRWLGVWGLGMGARVARFGIGGVKSARINTSSRMTAE